MLRAGQWKRIPGAPCPASPPAFRTLRSLARFRALSTPAAAPLALFAFAAALTLLFGAVQVTSAAGLPSTLDASHQALRGEPLAAGDTATRRSSAPMAIACGCA